MGVYCLPVLEARGLKSRCRQGSVPPEDLGEGPSCLFQLMVAQVFWIVVTSLQFLL